MSLNFEGLNVYQTIVKIFLNNAQSSFLSIVIGLCFGFLGIFSAIFNGYIGGYVGRKAAEISGLDVLLKLFPHGIFELPAIFISIGIGIFLASKFIKNTFNIKNKKKIFFILFIISTIFVPIAFCAYLQFNQLYSIIFSMIILFSMIFVFSKVLSQKDMKKDIIIAIKTYFLIILPLLLVGAIIEGILIFI
jgi:hypothetical protein